MEATTLWCAVRPASAPPTSTPTALMASSPVSAVLASAGGVPCSAPSPTTRYWLSPPPTIDSTTKNTRLSRIGGDSSSRQPSAGALAASVAARLRHMNRATAGGSRLQGEEQRGDETERRRADKGAAPSHHALHEQQGDRRDRRADHAGAGVEREHLGDAVRARRARTAARSRPGGRPCWRAPAPRTSR